MNYDLAKKIKKVRLINNLNQSEFANSVGITNQKISRIELGQEEITADILINIAEKYNIDFGYFTGKEIDYIEFIKKQKK